MQISSRFTIAVHILTCIELLKERYTLTSEFLAQSVGVNPVVIRRIIGQLKKAGLISVTRGASGGALLAVGPHEITLYDVYRAVDSVREEGLFRFHENPNDKCTVGRRIHNILDHRLLEAEKALEQRLRNMRLSEMVQETREYDGSFSY